MKKEGKKPLIHIHIFTYYGDCYIVKETVMCAKQALPEANVVVIDEGEKQTPPNIRKEIEDLGAEWRISTFPRRGNLRGKECVMGILTEMLASAMSDQDLLIKLDADTCLMNGEELRTFAENSQKIMCACGAMDDRIYGCCYGIKAHAVDKALQYIRPLNIPEHAPEDIMIGLSIFNLFPDPDVHTIHSTAKAGTTWKVFNWWDYPDPRKYRLATITTTGNPPNLPMSKKQRPHMMRYLRNEAESYIKSITQ